MSNRVEDLERQVAELQAAVNGLTEELVEMKERVRQVEDAQEVSVAADAAESAEPAQSESTDAAAEESKATGGERRTHPMITSKSLSGRRRARGRRRRNGRQRLGWV